VPVHRHARRHLTAAVRRSAVAVARPGTGGIRREAVGVGVVGASPPRPFARRPRGRDQSAVSGDRSPRRYRSEEPALLRRHPGAHRAQLRPAPDPARDHQVRSYCRRRRCW
jgi:hypothetical protein